MTTWYGYCFLVDEDFDVILTLLKGGGGLLDDGSVPVSDCWRHQLVMRCCHVLRDICSAPGHVSHCVTCVTLCVTLCHDDVFWCLDTGQHLLSLVTCGHTEEAEPWDTRSPGYCECRAGSGAGLCVDTRPGVARERRETTGKRRVLCGQQAGTGGPSPDVTRADVSSQRAVATSSGVTRPHWAALSLRGPVRVSRLLASRHDTRIGDIRHIGDIATLARATNRRPAAAETHGAARHTLTLDVT